jgi:hypothetical protein
MDQTSSAGSAPRQLRPEDVSLLTVSYRGDLELARDLCATVDRFWMSGAEHVLVVPEADLALFEPLAGPSRRVLTVESVLPKGYVQLPVPRQVRVGPLSWRIREMWAYPGGVVRGWIVQQVIKLASPSFIDREVIVLADSDIVLVAPVTIDRLVHGDSVRLYGSPGASADLATHVRWHEVSAELLGFEPRGYLGSDYIGNLITWRRSTVLELQRHLSRVAGKRWDKVVARQRRFSEYTLYGIYAEHVRGAERSGHRAEAEDLIHAGWFFDLDGDEGIEEFVDGFTPGQLGVAIQSTEPFTLEERRELIRRTTARLAPTPPV